MLAYLLPGLRHTRTPLIAGGLWLLITRLVLGDRLLPDAEGGRVESLLYELGTLVGGAAILAGLALLATLIGGMTPRLPVRLIARRLAINKRGRWWQVAVCWFFGIELDLAVARGEFNHWVFRRFSLAPQGLEWSQFTGNDCPPVLQVGARDSQENGSARIGGERLAKADFAGDDDPTPYDWLEWGMAEASIRTEVDTELPLQLHVERESLFYEYDRGSRRVGTPSSLCGSAPHSHPHSNGRILALGVRPGDPHLAAETGRSVICRRRAATAERSKARRNPIINDCIC
jgi:hypothetical protein